MKNLADFKRAMIVGSRWLRKHVNEGDFVERTVSRVGSNHVWVMSPFGNEARLDFPKASEFEINEAGEAEIYWPPYTKYENGESIEVPRQLVLTYKKA